MELHLNDMLVEQAFIDCANEFMEENPGKKITYGNAAAVVEGSLYGRDKDSEWLKSRNRYLLSVLRKYLFDHRLRAVDLFNTMQKNKKQTMGLEEMFRGLRKAKVPLKDRHLRELIYLMDIDHNGEIEYWEFAAVNHESFL